MNKLSVAFAACALNFAALSAQAEDLATRFGNLTVNADNVLLFRGKPMVPSVEGNSGLSFIRKFEIGSKDVALVQDIGGTACPAQFYFVTITAAGATSSPAFGTCSDLVKLKRATDIITVTMPGFLGSSEAPAAIAKAAREQHIFTFTNGHVTEAGKSTS